MRPGKSSRESLPPENVAEQSSHRELFTYFSDFIKKNKLPERLLLSFLGKTTI